MNLGLLAIVIAGCSLIAVLIQLVMIVGLRLELAKLRDSSEPKSHQSRVESASCQVAEAMLLKISDHFNSFDTVFTDMQRQLAAIRGAVASSSPDRRSAATSNVAVAKFSHDEEAKPEDLPPTQFDPPGERFNLARGSADSQLSTEPLGPEVADRQVALASGHLGRLVEQYRLLLAEPRKNEINRWLEDNGGIRCEAADDGEIVLLGRDGSGLLTLLPTGEGGAIVVPSGRLIADFATSFASSLALRPITRELFALINDGSGMLRLIEPAVVKSVQDRWKLVHAGTLSGLTSG